VIPKVVRAPRPNLIATQVVARVRECIPFRFTVNMHTEATYRLGARTRSSESGVPGAVDPKYCEYVSSVKRHLYNGDWVERLRKELADETTFEEATGRPAEPLEA